MMAEFSPATMDKIAEAQGTLSEEAVDRMIEAANALAPQVEGGHVRVTKMINAVCANPNLDDALGKLARMGHKTGMGIYMPKLAAYVASIPDDAFSQLVDQIENFDEEEFNTFCDTISSIDPKVTAFAYEKGSVAASAAAEYASYHVPTGEQVNYATKMAVDQANRIAANPNTPVAAANIQMAAEGLNLQDKLSAAAAYLYQQYGQLPEHPIDSAIDATAGVTPEQIALMKDYANAVSGLAEAAKKLAKVASTLTPEQIEQLV